MARRLTDRELQIRAYLMERRASAQTNMQALQSPEGPLAQYIEWIDAILLGYFTFD